MAEEAAWQMDSPMSSPTSPTRDLESDALLGREQPRRWPGCRASRLLAAGASALAPLAVWAACRGGNPAAGRPRASPDSSLEAVQTIDAGTAISGVEFGVSAFKPGSSTGETSVLRNAGLTVLSNHPGGFGPEGAYFGFDPSEADQVFGTNHWDGSIFRVSCGSRYGNITLWKNSDLCKTSCGRWHPTTEARAGDWSVGDKLVPAGAADQTTSVKPASTSSRTTPPEVSPAPLYEFYMYRANSKKAQQYTLGNINTGNLDGVVWYLMNEVVTMYTDGSRCPRKFNISDLNRYRVRTRATREMFQSGMNFGTRFSFDFGKCMGRCFPDNLCTGQDDCDFHYRRYGFNVGCNNFVDKYPFPDGDTPAPRGTWYTLPLDGRCEGEPTGAKDCTWSFEDAGVLSLEEIEALNPVGPNCCPEDRCTGFWENMFDEGATTWRVDQIQGLFGQKYPDMPVYVGDSQCDFNRDVWYSADKDIWVPRDPWAKINDSEPTKSEDKGGNDDSARQDSQQWHDDSYNRL